MKRTLYITRNGMLEPLGQSQVLSYLRGLSDEYRITVISFEKPEDWKNSELVEHVRIDCESRSIQWLPQRFYHRPKVIAPAFSILILLWLCLRETRSGNAELIHARSYIPAAVAMIAGRLTETPFIFDMRALWPEELITAGRMKRGSWMHRGIAWAELICLQRAKAVVSLTHAAVDYLHQAYPTELHGQKIDVIPTCADLERFAPSPVPRSGPPIYSCIGTILSGWFQTQWLKEFFAVAAKQDQTALFEIVTRDDPNQVRRSIDPEGILWDRLAIFARAPAEMPDVVQQHTASVMFFTRGLSKIGSSPTRLGEILGCGIPVVANDGVGDVASIIREHRVGVLAENQTPQAMLEAWRKLEHLQDDPDLSKRCRSAAESVFSLDAGTKCYRDLYRRMLSPRN